MSASWAAAVGAAIAVKISASIDDVAWLLPFVAGPQRCTNYWRALQYIITTLAVSGTAIAVAIGGGAAVSAATGSNTDWPAERVLGLISGVALAAYGLFLFKGWWGDHLEELEEARAQKASQALASIVATARAAEAFFKATTPTPVVAIEHAQSRPRAPQDPRAPQEPRAPQASDPKEEEGMWGWFQRAIGVAPADGATYPPAPSAVGSIELSAVRASVLYDRPLSFAMASSAEDSPPSTPRMWSQRAQTSPLPSPPRSPPQTPPRSTPQTPRSSARRRLEGQLQPPVDETLMSSVGSGWDRMPVDETLMSSVGSGWDRMRQHYPARTPPSSAQSIASAAAELERLRAELRQKTAVLETTRAEAARALTRAAAEDQAQRRWGLVRERYRPKKPVAAVSGWDSVLLQIHPRAREAARAAAAEYGQRRWDRVREHYRPNKPLSALSGWDSVLMQIHPRTQISPMLPRRSTADAISTADALVLARCRALMLLRNALGEAAYESRRNALLEELVVSNSVENAAAALNSLHSIGFISSNEEFGAWTDRLLSAEQALASRSAELRGASLEARRYGGFGRDGEEGAGVTGAADGEDDGAAAKDLTARALLVVSVLGSLDDLAVQISLLLAGTFTWAQLLLGVTFGSSLVVCFCFFVTLFKPIVAVIQLVPLFAIVFCFAAYTLITVALFEPADVLLLPMPPAWPLPPIAPSPAMPPGTGRMLWAVSPTMPPWAPPLGDAHHDARPGADDPLAIYRTAAVLSLGSSTDNFAIGASLGIAGLMLKLKFNVLIAAANGVGALVAAAGAHAIGQMANSFGLWIAASVFAYLAWQEGGSLWAGEPASPLLKLAERGVALQLAVPMTLNNLAGGIAGGVVGIGPLLAGSSAFCASFAMMATGFFVGQRLHSVLHGSQLDVRLFSCSIFVTLAYGQVSEKLQALWEAHVPFHLALPLVPAGSDALVALLLVGAAFVGGLFALRQCAADDPKHDVLASGDTGEPPATALHAYLILERARALMQLRGALGEAAYESRRHALLEELVRSANSPQGSLERAAAVLESLHGFGFLDRGHVAERAELVLWVDRLLDTEGTQTKVVPESSLRRPSPSSSGRSSPHSTRSTWRRILPFGSPERRKESAYGARSDLV